MNLYIALFISLILLLALIVYLRVGSRHKFYQRDWVERLETIAKDNQTVWSTVLPYSQREKVIRELQALKADQSNEGMILQISEKGEWSSPVDLLKYSAVKRLFKKLLPQIIAYSRTLGLDPKFLTLKAWAWSGVDLSLHQKSKDALFSGRYFISGEDTGELSFFKKGDPKALFARFTPHSGDLLLFPSDMQQKQLFENEDKKNIQIAFDVHFGNKKKSWLVSKITDLESQREHDPFYDQSAEPNKRDKKASHFTHISKIK